jgi:hypothetical protein
MRTWIPTALLALAIGVLGFHVIRLHGEVDRLSRAVGTTEEPSKRRAPSGASSGAPSGKDGALSRRVATLEKELEEASERVAILQARQELVAGAAIQPDPEKTKEQVLSIVADEADRVFVEQLLWHRNNLLAARQPGFNAFAHVAQLTQPQSQAVWGHLEAEADAFVALFRSPELRKDPTAVIREIRAILTATDDKVRSVLTGNQVKLYEDARAVEQAALMPWLKTAEPAQ